MDFGASCDLSRPRRHRAMNEDVVELIAATCTRVGMIMEDASLLAVTMPRNNPDAARDALGRLASSLEACRQLIAAATALHQPIG